MAVGVGLSWPHVVPTVLLYKYDSYCTATNIVYLIKCSGCGKEYIGESSNIRAQVRVHKQQTLDLRLRHLYVNHHIAHCTIGKSTLFQIIPFHAVNRDDKIFRDEIELHFIKQFRPELNRNKINQSEAVQT